MFTTALASAPAACGARGRVRALGASPAVTTDATINWYVPAMGAASGFGHKHPARRPPSRT